MTETTVRLGCIGLGNMGAAIARRLVDWPGGLTVYDVRSEAMKPFVEAGARGAEKVADVAEADVISIIVLDDAQVRQVVAELAPAAKPGTVIAIHSTIADGTAAELAQRLQTAGGDVSLGSSGGSPVGCHRSLPVRPFLPFSGI